MRFLGLNDRGRRVGQDHYNAKITDAEVELIRKLHEEGMSYSQLALKFEVSKSAVARIVRFEFRANFPVAWRRID